MLLTPSPQSPPPLCVFCIRRKQLPGGHHLQAGRGQGNLRPEMQDGHRAGEVLGYRPPAVDFQGLHQGPWLQGWVRMSLLKVKVRVTLARCPRPGPEPASSASQSPKRWAQLVPRKQATGQGQDSGPRFQCVGAVFHQQAMLRHQLGALGPTSVLTLSAWREHRSLQVKGAQALQACALPLRQTPSHVQVVTCAVTHGLRLEVPTDEVSG